MVVALPSSFSPNFFYSTVSHHLFIRLRGPTHSLTPISSSRYKPSIRCDIMSPGYTQRWLAFMTARDLPWTLVRGRTERSATRLPGLTPGRVRTRRSRLPHRGATAHKRDENGAGDSVRAA